MTLAAIFYFWQLFVLYRLISKSVLKWFLLIMCKEYTLRRSKTLLSNNHPALYCCLRREGQRMPLILVNFMIRSNCPESSNEFLDNYFFNLRKCGIFANSHFKNHNFKKSNRPLFVNINLVFSLAACTNRFVDSFLYKYTHTCSIGIVYILIRIVYDN